MNKLRKKRHQTSTFSLLEHQFYFWFDLALVVISLISLAVNFFKSSSNQTLTAFLIFVSFAGLLPVLLNALKALIRRRLTIDLLASVALIFSLATHEWQSAVFIGLMLASARLFARYTGNRARHSIESLLKLRPTKVHVMQPDGRVIEEKIENLHIGDLVVTVSGERIAVDGIVESGEASVDQSSLTGESEPLTKKAGDEVLSSTLNLSGSLIIRARRVGQDTTFSKIMELVEKSQLEKTSITSVVDRFISWYILLTLAGSILLFLLSGKLELVLSILLVTCADDLAVAIPLAFTAAIGLAARRGIIVKGGKFFEGLKKIKTMVFDKTGTITEGRPRVEEVTAFYGYSSRDLLKLLGAAENESDHPAARAIQRYVASQKIDVPAMEKVHEEPGFGIKGIINGEEIFAGKTKFLKDNGVIFSVAEMAEIEKQKSLHRMVTVLSKNKKAVGFVSMLDAIRPNARLVLHSLKNAGINRLVILTGDNEKIAQEVAQRVGISEFKANLLPQDKINYLKQILSAGQKVAMVGDGVNDAASLALADVGIAMGAIGSDAAIESADVVLMRDNLHNIPEAINLSKYTVKIVHQNLWLWAVINAIGLFLVFAGILGPAGAAAFNFLTDFVPLLNSFRVFRYNFKAQPPAVAEEPVLDIIKS